MFLLYISATIRRFVKNEDAASAIEYAVIAAMVAIVVIAFITPIGDAVKGKFEAITTGLGGKLPGAS
jgi:pilus assembly protein Flp/PilA